MSSIAVKTGKWEVLISRPASEETWFVICKYIVKPSSPPNYSARVEESFFNKITTYEEATEIAEEFISYARKRMRNELRTDSD